MSYQGEYKPFIKQGMKHHAYHGETYCTITHNTTDTNMKPVIDLFV